VICGKIKIVLTLGFLAKNVNQKGFFFKLLTLLALKGYPKNDLKMEVYKNKNGGFYEKQTGILLEDVFD
jgi:hypothetical protein